MKYIITLFICINTLVLASAIQEGSLLARSDGNNITVQWTSTDEASVAYYEIERRSEGSGFSYVATIQKKGSLQLYTYIDKTAFKTSGTIYFYRIKTVYANNNVEYSPEVNVPHNVSSVKRTWGSLKAMFR